MGSQKSSIKTSSKKGSSKDVKRVQSKPKHKPKSKPNPKHKSKGDTPKAVKNSSAKKNPVAQAKPTTAGTKVKAKTSAKAKTSVKAKPIRLSKKVTSKPVVTPKKKSSSSRSSQIVSRNFKEFNPVDLAFKNTTAINPDGIHELSALNITKGKLSTTPDNPKKTTTIDLDKYYVYPGLVNSHDHLLGTYLPRVGRGPYLSWKPWDDDLKAAKLYQERGKLSNSEIYQLSYYRQILSGVTTVCDHIPHVVHQGELPSALVRVVEQYCLAHEISSYELKWGDTHEKEITKAKKKNIPFITHLEEGFDEESLRGTEILDSKSGVFNNAVLVHCVSCSLEDIRLIGKKKANMVWCPTSNMYMFNETARIQDFLRSGANICLGTDSPMSGSVNLLAEMKYASHTYHELYGAELSPSTLFNMVTINGAKAFKLDHLIGSITHGKQADLVLMKKLNHDPYEQLATAHPSDIQVVLRDGIPLFFTEEHLAWFKDIDLSHYEKITLRYPQTPRVSVKGYLIGKPLALYATINHKLGFKKELDFFPLLFG